MGKFWKSNHHSGTCSTYNMGLPLRIWLRICSAIGMVSSILYIISGTSLISHISQNEKATFSAMGITYSEHTRHIYYKRNAGFFIGIAVVLILINFVQLASDIMLFHSTLKTTKRRSLWLFFLLDVILWVLTLICFVTIFSGGGLFLLLVFLVGTGVRVYIVFILHEYMLEETKIHTKVPIPVVQPPPPVTTIVNVQEPGISNSDNLAEIGKSTEEVINLPNNVILEVEEMETVVNSSQVGQNENEDEPGKGEGLEVPELDAENSIDGDVKQEGEITEIPSASKV